ncbi:hypothetical protein NO995_10265 [Aestuariibaculum sp. M13]|uniref:hypothetical protein n=1 Tax=Aestuariibaculum sp. M13 TaxID=2967132 RepID=UPI00215A09C4|nr:hypothetical protein [Aestuariibaculum sp. M13]MCR8668067.1 hypothetical protein [Aestuariibaculum sp. M13]
MRKTATISLILVLFLSACKTDKNLKGTWIGEYSKSENGTIVFPERNLLTFKNNKCYSKGSKYDYGTELRESKNMYFSNDIIFNEDYSEENPLEYYEIVKAENDSLVIKIPNNEFQHVYRKLPESAKHKQTIKLIGKKFFWENRKFQDTIYFKTDSTLVRESNKHPDYKTSSWERINFEGYDIIFMDGDVPYLIEKQNGKTINLITFHKTDVEHTMTELE